MRRRRLAVGILSFVLAAVALAVPGMQLASPPVERLTNGGFEEGFYSTALGPVGNGWQSFASGGGAQYGFFQDNWSPVVQEGTSSQLIAISTIGQTGADAPHVAGIFQTVAVAPGSTYDLTLYGMIRALEDDPDRANYGYRVQYGVDLSGGTSWQTVSDWVDVPWDTVYPRMAPGPMQSYGTSVLASGERLTLFVRVLYKWGTANREVDVNVDGVSLRGALPTGVAGSGKSYTVVRGSGTDKVIVPPGAGIAPPVVALVVPGLPAATWDYKVAVTSKSEVGIVRLELYDEGALLGRISYEVGPLQLAHEFDWRPSEPGRHILRAVAYDALGGAGQQEATVIVGQVVQFLSNGSFEQGFEASDSGYVGTGWGAFHNGGRSQYGFYDETWIPAVYDGRHSQLVEINTMGSAGAEADRIAGIYQTVEGLAPGATYRLTLRGLLRVRADDPDREGYNYRVEWGYAVDGGGDWTLVSNWFEVPWDTVYLRTDPGEMSEHVVSFEAPASRVTLFIRAWKKWATVHRELDVNLDGIRLEGYGE